jgi:MFS transporter, DHA1 family, tetracycline resistance protein
MVVGLKLGRRSRFFWIQETTVDSIGTTMKENRQAAVPFILVTVFLDMMGIAIVIPVLPGLIATFTADRDAQTYWYGAMLASYGLMQFVSAPLLGALSDRLGRRPVLLVSIFGLAFTFLLTAMSPFLWLMLLARLIGGGAGGSFSVASAYVADVTKPEERSRSFGVLGAAFGLGFIFGPMIGGTLALVNIRLPYFAAAILGLVNWLYGFVVLPESLPLDRRKPFSIARANPFAALIALTKIRGVGGLVSVYTLTVFPQYLLQCTWVLYNTFRFAWTPWENGISLFLAGLVFAVGQGAVLGIVLRRFGDFRTALLGLTSSFLAYLLYGLAFEGWMMYAIVLGNLLGSVGGPALQGIISKAVDPREQGVTMGSLASINSMMGVIAPLVGTPLLSFVAHYPATDLRAGVTFYVAAVAQACALSLAYRRFRGSGGPTPVRPEGEAVERV